MKIIVCLILFGMAVGLYLGCRRTATPASLEDCEPQFPDRNVTYDNYVKGIVATYCTESCHRGGATEGLGDFTTYAGLLPHAMKRAFFFRVISDNADMPQGNAPLPQSVRDSLNIWINNCFPEN